MSLVPLSFFFVSVTTVILTDLFFKNLTNSDSFIDRPLTFQVPTVKISDRPKSLFFPRRLPVKQSGVFDFRSLRVDAFLQDKGTNLTQNPQPGEPGCLS